MWRRGRRPAGGETLRLEEVRRRLEILLAAVYERPVPVVPAEPPAPPGWLRRLFRRVPPHLRGAGPLPASDGERVHLPPELEAPAGAAEALGRYRLMAVQQAERLVRGTAALAPADPLARDLYLLAESAAAEAGIAAGVPGLAPALAAERAAALAGRPAPEALTPPEREVERLVRGVLADGAGEVPPARTPAESLAWATAQAARLREAGGRYRGLAPVAAWGTVLAARAEGARARPDVRGLTPRADGRGAGIHETDGSEGDPGERSEEGKNSTSADGGEAGDEAAEADEKEPAEEGAPDADGAPSASPPGGPGVAEAAGVGIEYPEWDFRAGRYRRPGATVRARTPSEGDGEWAARVLERHASLVRRLREQFERLRARRTRLLQQRSGDELDLAACVRALVELKAGRAVDDRLYVDVRPARREIAIALLVDVSGSTSEPVGGTRIIEVEKTALLLTGEALDALGDRYAVLAFSGKGADHVRVRTVKEFGERNGEAVRRRVAALQPEGYTRMGAALRHASALLARQGTSHRLLLILSDGKPNDEDDYWGPYGVEDSRQAIAEARAQGVYPFCITVDRKGSAYLTRIFGPTGHVILRDPEQLPLALVGVVKHLLAS